MTEPPGLRNPRWSAAAARQPLPVLCRSTKVMYCPTEVVAKATFALKKSHPGLRRVNVEGTDGSLVISGTVTCYYLKQLAQETIKSYRGELQLVNDLRVD